MLGHAPPETFEILYPFSCNMSSNLLNFALKLLSLTLSRGGTDLPPQPPLPERNPVCASYTNTRLLLSTMPSKDMHYSLDLASYCIISYSSKKTNFEVDWERSYVKKNCYSCESDARWAPSIQEDSRPYAWRCALYRMNVTTEAQVVYRAV